jgi:endogenous inhibitor of DNA gyrase (YacG/DUF329 family)
MRNKTRPTQRRVRRCPICDRPLQDAEDSRDPFCSARCQRIDLGRWLGGDYRVPSEEPLDPWAVPGVDDDGFS